MEKHKTIGKSMPDLFKDVKPVQHSKVKADSRIHNPIQNKRKVIQVFRNGEEYARPITVLLTHFEQQSVEIVLRSIGERVVLNDHRAVRRLYTMEGKLLKNVEDLEDGKNYVAAGKEAFIPLKYGTRTATLILGGRKDYDDIRLFQVPASAPAPRPTTGSLKMQRSIFESQNEENKLRRAKSQDRMQNSGRKPSNPTAKPPASAAKPPTSTNSRPPSTSTVKSVKSTTSTRSTARASNTSNHVGSHKQGRDASNKGKTQPPKKTANNHENSMDDGGEENSVNEMSNATTDFDAAENDTSSSKILEGTIFTPEELPSNQSTPSAHHNHTEDTNPPPVEEVEKKEPEISEHVNGTAQEDAAEGQVSDAPLPDEAVDEAQENMAAEVQENHVSEDNLVEHAEVESSSPLDETPNEEVPDATNDTEHAVVEEIAKEEEPVLNDE